MRPDEPADTANVDGSVEETILSDPHQLRQLDEPEETIASESADPTHIDTAETIDSSNVDPRALTELRTGVGRAPAMIGPFQVLKTIGSGGFGTVYLGIDRHLDRQVAIKVAKVGVLDENQSGDSCARLALRLSCAIRTLCRSTNTAMRAGRGTNSLKVRRFASCYRIRKNWPPSMPSRSSIRLPPHCSMPTQ